MGWVGKLWLSVTWILVGEAAGFTLLLGTQYTGLFVSGFLAVMMTVQLLLTARDNRRWAGILAQDPPMIVIQYTK